MTVGGVRAAFSPDGEIFAVASADGRFKTFDTGAFFVVVFFVERPAAWASSTSTFDVNDKRKKIRQRLCLSRFKKKKSHVFLRLRHRCLFHCSGRLEELVTHPDTEETYETKLVSLARKPSASFAKEIDEKRHWPPPTACFFFYFFLHFPFRFSRVAFFLFPSFAPCLEHSHHESAK